MDPINPVSPTDMPAVVPETPVTAPEAMPAPMDLPVAMPETAPAAPAMPEAPAAPAA